MAIYLNGDKVDLTKNSGVALEIKKQMQEMKELLGFPLQLKFPPEVIKHDPDNPNRPLTPANYFIKLRTTESTPDGDREWIYCERTNKKSNGVVEYYPRSFEVTGRGSLTEKKNELAWFLYYKSPNCINGAKDNTGEKRYFQIYDPKKEATKFIDKEQWGIRANALILDMEKHEIKDVCKAYNLHVEGQEHPQMKSAMINHLKVVSTKKPGYYKDFVDNYQKQEEFIEPAVMLAEALEAGKVKAESVGGPWFAYFKMSPDGTKSKELTRGKGKEAAKENMIAKINEDKSILS